MTIGMRIRTLRADAKLTQSELAQRLGVSPSAVGMYEQGRRQPDPEIVLKLCRLFDTTADWLLFGTGMARVQPGEPLDMDMLLREWRAGLTAHAGHLFYKTADGRRFPLTEEQLERLWQAIQVACAIALKSDRQ